MVRCVFVVNSGSRECEDVRGSFCRLIPSQWGQHCHQTADGCKRSEKVPTMCKGEGKAGRASLECRPGRWLISMSRPLSP